MGLTGWVPHLPPNLLSPETIPLEKSSVNTGELILSLLVLG